jgi:hypothetical protein
MVTAPAARPGHSLPEVIVAMTFLAATFGALVSATELASRRTAEAVVRQRALAVAGAVLDSLVHLPHLPAAGAGHAAGLPWPVEWEVEPAHDLPLAWIDVVVGRREGREPLVLLSGVWAPLPPELGP